MRPDQDIATDCIDQLHTSAGLDDTDIAVKVIDGVVLLAGIVRSDLERAQAGQTAKRVRGVSGLSDCLEVRPRNAVAPPDPQITREVVGTLRHQFPDQIEALRVLVHNGRVALEGELDWYYQRDLIEALVRSVRGVNLVTNKIVVGRRNSSAAG